MTTSSFFPAITDTHVQALKWNVATFGEAWLHGSGDIFTETYPDPEHKSFKVTAEINSNNAFNKASEAFSHSARKKYRKVYRKGDALPTSVLAIEAELQEAYKAAQTKKIVENQTVREVPFFDPNAVEEDTTEKKN